MPSVIHRVVALVFAAAAALAPLGTSGCAARPSLQPAWPDAEATLRDDGDRELAIDRLWVTPVGAERARARAPIAAALVRRIAEAIDEDRPFAAAALLDQLTALWQDDPGAAGRELVAHLEVLRGLRKVFGKAGALEPTIHTLVLLAETEPARRTAHLGEIDEVLEFADELAVADNGPDATRGQPIALLEPTALALPLAWLVDRYVALQVERQRAVAAVIEQRGASMQLVRAHHDFLTSARKIAGALSRGGRPGEIHRQLIKLTTSHGADRDLATRAEVVAEHPTPAGYAALASELAIDDSAPDAAAALAVCAIGLRRFPRDPALLAAAGGHARALGRIDQAIALHEHAVHTSSELDAMVALRLGGLYAERIERLASAGRPAAALEAWHAALRFIANSAAAHPHPAWQRTVAIAESALGRGLASQGMLDAAKQLLATSLERAPLIDAYETLIVIDAQTGRYVEAGRRAEQALTLLGDRTTADRYRRAKLERLAADSLRRSGKPRPAAGRYLDSLRTWTTLGDDKDLPRAIAAERKLEMSRTMWGLGEPAKAVDLAMRALDHDPRSEELATSAVAFLIQAGRYRDALDAFHRSLGQPAISDYHKTYMSLWILGEASRTGEPRDRLATEYLRSRRGDAWHETLAQLAAGKLAFADAQALATTGPRRAELAFYGATLGLDPEAATPAGRARLLERVVAARLVLDAEYDLARLYLQRP